MLRIGFIILLLIFPLGALARVQLFNSIAISLNDVLVFLVVSFWLLKKIIRKDFSFLKDSLFKPIIIFIAVAALSLLINIRNFALSEIYVSSLYLIRWIFYAGMYFLVTDFNTQFKKKISILLVISGVVTLLIGYVQYFLYPSLRNLIYLGWDEHLYRLFSSFLDPNFAGSFFVLYFLFLLGFIFNSFKKINKFFKVSLILLLTSTIAAIFLTYSRSAVIMLFAGIFTFSFISFKSNIKNILLVVLISLTVFTIIIFSLPYSFKTEGTNLLRTTSSFARIESMTQALTLFKENPILGVGFNTYRYASNRLGLTTGSQEDLETSHAGAGTDNSFLFVLATTGILGLISYIYLLSSILKTKDKIIISSMIALFINAIFINSLFYTFIMEWIWILLAIKENK